jgi:hypothetical protein
MNGLQPKSATDFFVLWGLRLMADGFIQSGKSLREEHDAMTYGERLQDHAGISREEYDSLIRGKTVGILTRKLDEHTLNDNPIYKDTFFRKVFFPSECSFSDSDIIFHKENHNVYVEKE